MTKRADGARFGIWQKNRLGRNNDVDVLRTICYALNKIDFNRGKDNDG